MSAEYFSWVRKDVLLHVPTSARQILSVGCGEGATEAELVKRGARVVGVEIDPAAAAVALSRGIVVFNSDASAADGLADEEYFDCLIYADVLEHLPDPLRVLRSHVTRLRVGGLIIVSVPNFRHYSVFWHLFVRGAPPEASAGIFDRTHLRITTRRVVEAWMRSVGCRVRKTDYVMPARRERYAQAATFGLLTEFVSRQVIMVAQKE